MTISEALKDLGAPVKPAPYRGNSEQYVTYQLIGQLGAIYAEGAEAATGVSFSVDVYAPTRAACVNLLLRAKAALHDAGWPAQAETEYYENAVDRWHMVLTAVNPGSEYG